MEKAEILEMTVAYVNQLHGVRCRSESVGEVEDAAPIRKSCAQLCNDDLRASEEYRAGFNECLVHVRKFLEDRTASAAEEVALPTMLVNHLSQFAVVDPARKSGNRVRVVRSSPPSPDTTLAAPPSADRSPSPPPTPSELSASPAVKARQNVSRTTATPSLHGVSYPDV